MSMLVRFRAPVWIIFRGIHLCRPDTVTPMMHLAWNELDERLKEIVVNAGSIISFG